MQTLWQDLRYALRLLEKSPGFAAVAVLTLALGIGANTAVFRVVDAVLLRPLPYKSPERLVLVSEIIRKLGNDDLGVSAAEYFDYRSRNRSFSETASFEHMGSHCAPSSHRERPLRCTRDRSATDRRFRHLPFERRLPCLLHSGAPSNAR
jgi:hypothetical protein